jgi:hypothetical protein
MASQIHTSYNPVDISSQMWPKRCPVRKLNMKTKLEKVAKLQLLYDAACEKLPAFWG